MGIVRTTVRTDFTSTGGPGYSTFHFRDDADGGRQAAIQNAANALQAAYTLLRPGMPESTLMAGEGRWVDVDTEEVFETPVWTVRGAVAGTAQYLPPATTLVIGWRTGTAARSGRGRTFLSGYTEEHNTGNGSPTQPPVDQARALGASIVNFNDTLGNGAFVVYSPTYRIARDIVGSAVRPRWAVLRSRRD